MPSEFLMSIYSVTLPVSISRAGRTRGFTLLELLAVVVTILILVALAFPATQFVLKSARNAKCVGNMRTIGAGLHAYMADFNGEYPPNRYNDRYTAETGRRPWPSEVLNGTVPTNTLSYVSFAGMGSANLKSRRDAGPWFCPGDEDRPVGLSASSYAFNIYLGRDDRVEGEASVWQSWWSKPLAHENSGRLVYLIDHNLLRNPLSTAGNFSEKSWPVKVGAKPAPGSGDEVVDFDRHITHANALRVDGSVQALTIEDLTGPTGRKLVDPTR